MVRASHLGRGFDAPADLYDGFGWFKHGASICESRMSSTMRFSLLSPAGQNRIMAAAGAQARGGGE
jgi:hypothetical protein